jgi:hypothetical protein
LPLGVFGAETLTTTYFRDYNKVSKTTFLICATFCATDCATFVSLQKINIKFFKFENTLQQKGVYEFQVYI